MTDIRLALSGLALAFAVQAGGLAQDVTPTRQTAEAWLTAYQAQNFEAMRSLLDQNSVFIDPTSLGRESFGNPINWQGADAILAGVRSWGVTDAQYHFDRTYESPGRVIYDGSIDVTYGAPDNQVSYNFPIITIVTVANGMVVEHRDYTDFEGAQSLGGEPAPLTDNSIINAYMAAYSAADFDAMEPFLAEDVVFSDPTATGLGEAGLLHHGREDIMAALREFDSNNNPIGLNFEWDTVFESNDRYVYMGRVNATYPTQQEGMVFQWSAAQTTVIHLRDGLVVEQYDFADYEGAEQGLVPESAN
ncbi:nuclear transport factor 2 family protein [Hyphobacterium sp. HN65]|uniref:Nuclear transport factor 2 family protein n=1 Tax=Hyphobacterium lacteum TaxID=3116575 RepID=A0ABU7LS26_9PROT|nr:nuclear transport factor 2 family protein [Hyphobacterium sp. HN65]MEE2526703.1 nuclear transport factor 2 family protein [Hyphobacterium sp. HN65]